jgi:hypothetical protein
MAEHECGTCRWFHPFDDGYWGKAGTCWSEYSELNREGNRIREWEKCDEWEERYESGV